MVSPKTAQTKVWLPDEGRTVAATWSYYFFCNLRNLRWYRRTKMIPTMPIAPKTDKAMSMFAIFIYLYSVNKKSHDKEYTRHNKSYPKGMPGELIGYKVSDDSKPHHKLTYIITILGEVVYLLFVYHGNIKRAMGVPKG